MSGVALAVAFPAICHAQAATNQVENRFKPPLTPTVQPEAKAAAKPSDTPPAKGDVKFHVSSVRMEGNTALSDAQLRQFYAPLVGKDISLAEAQAAAKSITAYYRKKGYVLSRAIIPAQRIEGGILTIQVIEGFVDQITVQGAAKHRARFIQQRLAPIKADHPLKLRTLERAVLAVEDLPGVSVKTVIAPSKSVAGASDLTVIISQKPVSAYAQIDNHGSKAIGPNQGYAQIDFNSLLGLNDQTSFKFANAPHGELSYYGFSHSEVLNSGGTKLTVSASHSRTKPGAALNAFQIAGVSNNLSFEISQPLLRSRSQNLTARFSVEGSDSKSLTGATKLYDDRLHVIRVGLRSDFVDTTLSASLPASTTIDISISQGIKGAGTSVNGSPLLSRAGGRVDFSKLSIDAVRIQSLPGRFDVTGRLQAQLSSSVLLASEQFSLGGSGIGRGYEPSELTGDHALAGSLQLNYHLPPGEPVSAASIYTFLDAGEVWAFHQQAGLPRTSKLSSAGIGVNVRVGGNTNFDAYVVKPRNRDATPYNHREPRLFLSLSRSF